MPIKLLTPLLLLLLKSNLRTLRKLQQLKRMRRRDKLGIKISLLLFVTYLLTYL